MGSAYSQPQREFFKFVVSAVSRVIAHSQMLRPKTDTCMWQLESLALSGNTPESGGLLSSFEALSCSSSVVDPTQGQSQGNFRQKMSKREMEQTLVKLVNDGWLGENKQFPGHYSIGVRGYAVGTSHHQHSGIHMHPYNSV